MAYLSRKQLTFKRLPPDAPYERHGNRVRVATRRDAKRAAGISVNGAYCCDRLMRLRRSPERGQGFVAYCANCSRWFFVSARNAASVKDWDEAVSAILGGEGL